MKDFKLLKDLNYDETEYIRIPKEWVEKLNKCESYEEQERLFFKALEDRKTDIKSQIESMEDDLLEFKAFGVRYKNELEKIYTEQYNKIEKLWEELNLSDNLYKKITTLKNSLSPTVAAIEEIDNKLRHIDTYRLDRVMDTLEKFQYMSKENKDLLKFLLEQEQNKSE